MKTHPVCVSNLNDNINYCVIVIGFFLTKIFHPNVAKNGAICVNTLKRDWKPEHGIKHILLVSITRIIHVLND